MLGEELIWKSLLLLLPDVCWASDLCHAVGVKADVKKHSLSRLTPPPLSWALGLFLLHPLQAVL